MSNHLKISMYVLLVIIAGISGYYALTNFGRMMDRAGDRTSDLEQIEPERKPAVEQPVLDPAATNTAAATTNATNIAGNAPTNAVAATGQTLGTPAGTNAVAAAEPAPAETTPAEITPAEPEVPTALSVNPGGGGKSGGGTRIGLWTALFFVSVIALGLLIASDVSHFLGNRALKTLYNEEGEGVKNPEYEEAEQVWANGRHLEAIGMMREYLQKNPREQHVALRIAEIYEKDLRNHLAAALEYEEVLKHKLPPDRWGWAAIHLCNLYFKLNQEEKGYDLLRRLVKEYPETPAAEKARKRLGQVDSAPSEQIATERNVGGSTPATSSPAAVPPASTGPASNLPPGFRPKK